MGLEIISIESKTLERKRKVRIWTPRQYDEDTSKSFPVIFLHDGQLCYSERDAELPFGSWQIDLRLQRLIDEGIVPPTVCVAIDNSARRREEYFPLTQEFERYEIFLVDELMPWAQQKLRINEEPENTFLMGSSLGGIVSFALALNNPHIFGAAACLSPWFEFDQNRYTHEILRPVKEKPPVRFYMDSGIRDWRGLDDGMRGMLLARLELLRLGFEEGRDLAWQVETTFATRSDFEGTPVKPEKYDEATWNQHNEFYFGRRSKDAMKFLLAGIVPPSTIRS